ncbi:uromodulin-like 1 [Discoglossus pictus]
MQEPEIGLSPLSYHLCDYNVTANVSKMVAFQKPYEVQVPCGGWIPWRLCTEIHYKTEYHSVIVPETTHVRRCCDGYEQVGDYCAPSLEKFSEFASRPAMCPNGSKEMPGNKCSSDAHCPVPQKCCNMSSGSFCASPAPQALDRNTIKYWYNGTIVIKIGFDELSRVDPGFFNHSRLLHAMITGELWPLNTCVHHISTRPAGRVTVQSQVLIGTNESDSLMNISSKLGNIVTRLPEVISIHIEDVNECSDPALHTCQHHEMCINLEGSYNCTNSIQPPTGGPDCSIFRNHSIMDVTSSGFHVYWSTDCPDSHSYTVQVLSMKTDNQSINTNQSHVAISGLAAGELYTVNVTFLDFNGHVKSWGAKVKTDAQILNVTYKITNYNMTENLQNSSSEEYILFVEKFVKEVKKSLSADVNPNEVTVEVYSLRAGSVIINFHVIISNMKEPLNVTSVLSSPNSYVFVIDQQSIVVSDFNECLTPLDNDCDDNAECKNMAVSYTCECYTSYVDINPSRPGRTCQSPGSYSSVTSHRFNTTIHKTTKSQTTLQDGTTLEMITQRMTSIINIISLRETSTILCDQENIGILIQRIYLDRMSIAESSLYLGKTSCNVSQSTDSYVQLLGKWNECGAKSQNNATHFVVKTTLYVEMPPTFPSGIQPQKPIGSIQCVFKNNILTSAGYSPPEGVNVAIEELQGDGNFSTEFWLFDGDQPMSKNLTLAATDDITVHIRIKTDDIQFKLIISECWATPSADAQDIASYPFINNSCALKDRHTIILSNGNSNNASFQAKVFAFVNMPVVYLHCRLHVCKENITGSCKPNCDGSRSVMSGEQVSTRVARMGPLHRMDHSHKEESPKESALGPGYIALIIILIFAFVAGAAAILICWHERRTGNYNFKLKSRDVGYQVFSN